MGQTDIWREEEHLIARSCGGKLFGCLVSVIPTIGVIALAVAWFRTNKQAWEMSETRANLVKHQTLQIAQLILDFNVEREMTALYVTARSDYTQVESKEALDAARGRSDRSLSQLLVWPGTSGEGPDGPDKMYWSKPLFAAFLGRHRLDVRHGTYFWDEVQYYTDVVDVLLGWFNRAADALPETGLATDAYTRRRVWQLLNTYGYLLGAVSYLGAEQALCTVFHAVVCFSHRETFYYANYSFAGEALHRLFRQSYPVVEGGEVSAGERVGDWRTASHRSFFPELYACRMEILADLDYIGMTSDPSSCSYGRKNETRFYETDSLSINEASSLIDSIHALLDQETADRALDFWWSAAALASSVAYVAVTHVARCGWVVCTNSRLRRKRKEKLAKFQTASSQLDQLGATLRAGDGTMSPAPGDCYVTCQKISLPPPPNDVPSNHHHRPMTTTTNATDNSNNLKLLLLDNNSSCDHSSSPSPFVALKVASV